MRKIFYIAIAYALTIAGFFNQGTVFAAPSGVQTLNTPTPRVGTLFQFVTEVLKIVIRIGLPVVALSLIISGYMFVTAQGDPKKLTDAKNYLKGAVIGGVIVLCAVVIATLVKNTIGQLGG
jgi:hypothetical protein